MTKMVNVLQHKRSGVLIVHPLGTFQSYGAYVGIYPYVQLDSNVSDVVLTSTIVELLKKSIHLSYHISDIERYRRDNQDSLSDQIRDKYFGKIRSTSDSARKFHHCVVEGRKTISYVRMYEYDQILKSMSATYTKKVRNSSTSIGQTIKDLFNRGNLP